MEHDFSGRFGRKFVGATERLERLCSTVFSVHKQNFVFHFFQPSLIPVSAFCRPFSVNVMISANGKRDSGGKFTSVEFCLTIRDTQGRFPPKYIENTF